uniref:hypothetical protein n=1 Tax=Methylomonas sp. AM2-LC TaxID=3153301 RepID=UPI0032673F36
MINTKWYVTQLGFFLILIINAISCTEIPKKDVIKSLTIDECVHQKKIESASAIQKSEIELRIDCDKELAVNSDYQRSRSGQFKKIETITYDVDQEYYDQSTWDQLIEKLRQKYYPSLGTPTQEIAKSIELRRIQEGVEDKSADRLYTPKILPASPYLMSYVELKKAEEVVWMMYWEKPKDSDERGSIMVIKNIIESEIFKKEARRR